MAKLSQNNHYYKDSCDGATCEISRQWYEEAKEKLAAYEDAEEQGRLLRLPDASHKTYFAIDTLNCEASDCPLQNEKGECDYKCPKVVLEIDIDRCTVMDLIGREIYATREDGEAALVAKEGVSGNG